MPSIVRFAAGIVLLLSIPLVAFAQSPAELQRAMEAAARPGPPWNGPTTGPRAVGPRQIVYVAEDLRNGGVLGVAQGVREAATAIGWQVQVLDAGGTAAGRQQVLAQARAMHPDGLIVGGMDARDNRDSLAPFAGQIPVVGWHVAPQAGPVPETPVAMNVTTNPLEVAQIAAAAAISQSRGTAGVVIFTDSRYQIAMAKANAMAEEIRTCGGCRLLEIRDLAISDVSTRMAATTRTLLTRYGKRWTHGLAINDLYFDYATATLTDAGLAPNGLSLLSAGDGSSSAFLRIQAQTFQTATVAEPLNLQGWQLIDELNRLFAGQPVSGFVPPVHLVTAQNITQDGGLRGRYDPDNGYRDVYRRIWKR